jgi:NAD(P)H-nitrite reductase large subunit
MFGFRSFINVLAIDRYISVQGCTKAVIFGGGYIGVDAALALRHHGLDVAIVHRNTRLLSRMTDEEGGGCSQRACWRKKTDIEIHLRTTVKDFSPEGDRFVSVRLDKGENIETPLLILTHGVLLNSEPLKGEKSGIDANGNMQADPCVYLAGDLVITRYAVTGIPGSYCNYPNAVRQARTAARHLVHGEGLYAGSLNCMVLLKHIDFLVISLGRFSGEAVTSQLGDVWRRVYLLDGRINGYILVGDKGVSGYIYKLYFSRKSVDSVIRSIIYSRCPGGFCLEMLVVVMPYVPVSP